MCLKFLIMQLSPCAKVEQNDRYNPPVPNILLMIININGQNKILLDKELWKL